METKQQLRAAADVECAALVEELAGLSAEQWATRSLCERWTVEDVTAHLAAAAGIGPVRWMVSVLGARFDFHLHNERRLSERRGRTPQETLANLRSVTPRRGRTAGPPVAWLAEVIVHGQDIRRPLGLATEPSRVAAEAVARFFASRDFAVDSKSAIAGLRLEATDGPFATGAGPVARGTTVALVMAMAGRAAYCDDLNGAGAETLRSRAS
jgi:uncharacterized protein (TIGR03083 family)